MARSENVVQKCRGTIFNRHSALDAQSWKLRAFHLVSGLYYLFTFVFGMCQLELGTVHWILQLLKASRIHILC